MNTCLAKDDANAGAHQKGGGHANCRRGRRIQALATYAWLRSRHARGNENGGNGERSIIGLCRHKTYLGASSSAITRCAICDKIAETANDEPASPLDRPSPNG